MLYFIAEDVIYELLKKFEIAVGISLQDNDNSLKLMIDQ